MIRTLTELFTVATVFLATSLAAAQPLVERVDQRPPEVNDADQTGYLGVIADDRTESKSGVELLEVVAGGPAEKAGLEQGDVVIKIDDGPIRTLDDFARALERRPAGSKIRFAIERHGKPKLADVTLGARPPAESRRFPNFGRIEDAQPPRMSLLGVRVEPVDPDSPVAASLPAAQGAYVVRVAAGSPAAQAGIPVHAVIVAVDGKGVADPADLKEIIAATRPGQEIKIAYYSRGKLSERRVTLAEMVPEGMAIGATGSEPLTDDTADSLTDQERIEQLEQRLRRLEQRVQELEGALDLPR